MHWLSKQPLPTMVDLSVLVTASSSQSEGYSKLYIGGESLLAP
jgi:hypothetical protein